MDRDHISSSSSRPPVLLDRDLESGDVGVLRDLLRRGPVDCNGHSLRGMNCNGMDLRGLIAKKSNLTASSFVGADLTGADLSRATLTSTDFSNAILDGADMSEVVARKAVFVGASAKNVNASDGSFTGANWTNADCSGSKFNGADCRLANFACAKISKTKFCKVRGTGANFSGTTGDQPQFGFSDLSGAAFVHASYTPGMDKNANPSFFPNTILNYADLTHAQGLAFEPDDRARIMASLLPHPESESLTRDDVARMRPLWNEEDRERIRVENPSKKKEIDDFVRHLGEAFSLSETMKAKRGRPPSRGVNPKLAFE